MPDWTYIPLKSLAGTVLGVSRSRRWALRVLAAVVAAPGGRAFVAFVLGRFRRPDGVQVGAVVPARHARDALRVLPALGASVVEVDPGVEITVIDDPRIGTAVAALSAPGATVIAGPAVLLDAGPAWFRRVLEAATPTAPAQPWRDLPRDPRRWPSWVWGVVVGIGMVCAGLGAAVITLGPVLLWYDRDYLGLTTQGLNHIDHDLVDFLQHDRLTMAGTMVSIGVLYAGLAWGGIRRGWLWARDAYLISGVVGFPTLFYFLSTGFVEPLHLAVAVALFPLFLLAVWRSPAVPRWTVRSDGPERLRRRALLGQLLMILTGVGLLAGGAVISVVGMTGVFVPTDLEFLDTDTAHLRAANPHLVPFIAHDRAGFGGALLSAAIAVILLSMWGWRRGEAWVWWTLLLSAAAGFGPTLAIHFSIHYTDLSHLAPVYVGVVLTAIALILARPFLCDTGGE
ncbi:hypothetical protein [Catenulispora acidiphila]|uniref:hypothetical protein n=1 Tax=Catenulispora acidiphila TaxID=304895 RepID=UPI00059FD2A5|nr:hypothetical protein [Catenulispora acidiphila]